MENYTCCFCGKKSFGWGNNPWPADKTDSKCCDECNLKIVLPARIEMFKKGKTV